MRGGEDPAQGSSRKEKPLEKPALGADGGRRNARIGAATSLARSL